MDINSMSREEIKKLEEEFQVQVVEAATKITSFAQDKEIHPAVLGAAALLVSQAVEAWAEAHLKEAGVDVDAEIASLESKLKATTH